MTTTTTREVPMLFSAPMIRALLDGTKTQTRRLMKPQPPWPDEISADSFTVEWYVPSIVGRDGEERDGKEIFGAYFDDWGIKSPIAPGDVIWVRETWAMSSGYDDMSPADAIKACDGIPNRYYRAGGAICGTRHHEKIQPTKWRPSIHMPRWACRIRLLVESVRVERLQEISEEDARAEGICPLPLQDGNDPSAWWESSPGVDQARTPVASFRKLWNRIHGPDAWSANPFVWVYSFKRI